MAKHFFTDRKRAVGLGAAGHGTEHHWRMTLSSLALLVLVPLFVITFGHILGRDHAAVVAYYQRPIPAAIALLTFLVGFLHFRGGVQTALEDYFGGLTRKLLIALFAGLAYALAALGAIAVIRLAL